MFWKVVWKITTFPISEKLSDSIYLVKSEITTCESLLHHILKCNPSTSNFLRISQKLLHSLFSDHFLTIASKYLQNGNPSSIY